MLKVKFSPESRLDMLNIWDYGATNFGTAQSDLYVSELKERIFWLSQNPVAWLTRNDISTGLFCCHEGAHTIFFEIIEDHLWVYRILHQRMDPTRHL